MLGSGMLLLDRIVMPANALVRAVALAFLMCGAAGVATGGEARSKQPVSNTYAAMSQTISMDEIRGMLKKAKGIGLWTKLTLANRVNRFTEDFYWFHKKAGGKSLFDMQQRFDHLHRKIVSILKPDNPDLTARFIAARAALWYAYRDPIAYANSVGKDVIARIERPRGSFMNVFSTY